MVLGIAITIYHKSRGARDHDRYADHSQKPSAFRYDDVDEVSELLPDEWMLFGNFPKYINFKHPEISEIISQVISDNLEEHTNKKLVGMCLHLSPVASILLWAFAAFSLLEFVTKLFVKWLEFLIKTALVTFLAGILLNEYSSSYSDFLPFMPQGLTSTVFSFFSGEIGVIVTK